MFFSHTWHDFHPHFIQISAPVFPLQRCLSCLATLFKTEPLHRSQPPFSSAQSLNRVQLLATPWSAARQASLFITNSQSLLKLMSIVLVMPSSHLFLCRPLLPLPSVFPGSTCSFFFFLMTPITYSFIICLFLLECQVLENTTVLPAPRTQPSVL